MCRLSWRAHSFDDIHFALGAIKPAEFAAFAKRFPLDPRTIEHIVVVSPDR
ncbi:MAG: hypothetical protein U0792_06905 [Gemmataceae bacterium]